MTGPTAPSSTVLVVDDDDDLRDTICELLEERGYAVHTAGQGAEALEVLATLPRPPGLILLDLMMPVMDGWQMLERLGEDAVLSRIPVVLLSASIPSGNAKVARMIRKPVKLQALLAVVEEHCSPAARERA